MAIPSSCGSRIWFQCLRIHLLSRICIVFFFLQLTGARWVSYFSLSSVGLSLCLSLHVSFCFPSSPPTSSSCRAPPISLSLTTVSSFQCWPFVSLKHRAYVGAPAAPQGLDAAQGEGLSPPPLGRMPSTEGRVWGIENDQYLSWLLLPDTIFNGMLYHIIKCFHIYI